MDSDNQFLNTVIAGSSTSTSDSLAIPPELLGLAPFPLVPPIQQPTEYREYQHPIPPMSPTPLPAHCNSTAWGRNMSPLYSPYNFPYSSYYLDYFGTPSPYYGNNEDVSVPPYAHINNLPLARLVYRAMNYIPVYRPLLSVNPSKNVPTNVQTNVPPTNVTTDVPSNVPPDVPSNVPPDVPSNVPPDIPSIVPTNVPQDLSKAKKVTVRHLCQYCKKTYATPSGLSKHQQYHCAVGIVANKAFNCRQCDKVCENYDDFKQHTKSHVIPCKCNLCDKSFSRSWLLQGHMRTHTGEKPYTCQQCKRTFADRSNLRAHILVHNNARKYSCSVCTKSFTRMSLLLKHTETNCPAHKTLMEQDEQNEQTS